ncbi:hypothetical protein K443DRAFT_382590 [Laccaria amethystina LaAM-08-1]|uniref:Uncharacterized protein n=1 Tax=Laccaria amethystina LaAM-08-1 TaxID=1095629 RepID=A0A0C9WQX1_9AGAR|nr:hypothetical protein K443DRAFT_382590 [Laccaria amethystina LaAM-08-1]
MYSQSSRGVLGISNWTIWHRLEYERPFGFASPINAVIQDCLFSMLEINDQHEATSTCNRAGRCILSKKLKLHARGGIKELYTSLLYCGSSTLNPTKRHRNCRPG